MRHRGTMQALVTTLTLADVAAATAARLDGPAAGTGTIAGVSIDSRTVAPGDLFVAISGPRFDGHDFVAEAASRGAAAALVQRDPAPSRPIPLLRVRDTARALGDLARHIRLQASVPVVAITGSTGKTTTKDMAATLLAALGPVLKTEGNLNNQYGVPLTLLGLSPGQRSAVLELGMSAAGELRYLSAIAHPDIAVITNVAPVHLQFFDSVDAIAQAKAETLEGLAAGGVAVLNADDPRLRRIGESHGGEVVWFGRDRSCRVSGEGWRGTAHGMRFDLRIGADTADIALELSGPHHMINFLAAAAVADRLGVAIEAMAEIAPRIRAAPRRGQVLRLGQGITLIDDSYNSNPTAVEAAVVSLGMTAHERRVAFLGDMLELGPGGPQLHRAIGAALVGHADVVVAVGPLAQFFLDGAQAAGFHPSGLHAFPDSPTAALGAPDLVAPGDAVLVKGSRGVRMERVVEALVSRFGMRREESEGRDRGQEV